MRDITRLNIPNLISFLRLLSVPIAVWLILNDGFLAAFWIFLAAGVSDALDGFIAKTFHAETELGGYLDPIADKALLVSVFVSLGQAGYVDSWLVILVVFRDALILFGAFLYHLLYQDLSMQPLLVSKVNTLAQILLVLGVLGAEGFSIDDGPVLTLMTYVVAVTTFVSGAAYVYVWGRRIMAMEPDNQ